MKKHEFMTRLTNALHSPSSVCSAALRSQLLPGETRGAPAPVRHQKELRRIRTTLQVSNARLLPQILNRSYLKNRCTITGGAYRSVRRVAWCVRNS